MLLQAVIDKQSEGGGGTFSLLSYFFVSFYGEALEESNTSKNTPLKALIVHIYTIPK